MVSKPVVTAKSYQVDVSINDMLRILKLDARVPAGLELYELLKEFGCYEIEYDGHFGPHVFYSLVEEDDNDVVQAKIVQCIADFIKQRMPREQ